MRNYNNIITILLLYIIYGENITLNKNIFCSSSDNHTVYIIIIIANLKYILYKLNIFILIFIVSLTSKI